MKEKINSCISIVAVIFCIAFGIWMSVSYYNQSKNIMTKVVYSYIDEEKYGLALDELDFNTDLSIHAFVYVNHRNDIVREYKKYLKKEVKNKMQQGKVSEAMSLLTQAEKYLSEKDIKKIRKLIDGQ